MRSVRDCRSNCIWALVLEPLQALPQSKGERRGESAVCVCDQGARADEGVLEANYTGAGGADHGSRCLVQKDLYVYRI